jgi:hypothetical protein
MGYLSSNLIALSPSLPVLNYIYHYVANTPAADQLSLHEVFVNFAL